MVVSDGVGRGLLVFPHAGGGLHGVPGAHLGTDEARVRRHLAAPATLVAATAAVVDAVHPAAAVMDPMTVATAAAFSAHFAAPF